MAISGSPASVAFSAKAAPFAYVTSGGNDVLVIATATNAVGTTIAGGLALGGSDLGRETRAYVADVFSNNASVDTATDTVVATVAVAVRLNPFEVAGAPDGKHAYVTVTTRPRTRWWPRPH